MKRVVMQFVGTKQEFKKYLDSFKMTQESK